MNGECSRTLQRHRSDTEFHNGVRSTPLLQFCTPLCRMTLCLQFGITVFPEIPAVRPKFRIRLYGERRRAIARRPAFAKLLHTHTETAGRSPAADQHACIHIMLFAANSKPLVIIYYSTRFSVRYSSGGESRAQPDFHMVVRDGWARGAITFLRIPSGGFPGKRSFPGQKVP